MYMAMAAGRSKVLCGEPTLHTRTAIAVAEQLTSAEFEVLRPEGSATAHTICCTGAGLVAAGWH